MALTREDLPTFPPGELQERQMSNIYGFDSGGTLWRRVAVNGAGELIVSGGGGGVGITDTDDNSLAAGQTTLLSINETYIFDGTVWIRQFGQIDNAVAPASPQGSYVGGNVNAGLPAYTAGDFSVLNFDLSGRLLVSASISMVTDTDDNAIASGQVLDLIIQENYIFNGSVWMRQEGGVDDSAAPAFPQGAFTAGKSTATFPALATGDAVVDRFTNDGAKITIPRTQQPFELLLSTATLAASGTIAGTTQQNDFFLGSLGRTLLAGFVNYAGTASSVTAIVEISVDGGGSFITVDTFTVLSGTPAVIRNLSVALGNRVRVTVTNNDGANSTGTTNIGFYLTHGN